MKDTDPMNLARIFQIQDTDLQKTEMDKYNKACNDEYQTHMAESRKNMIKLGIFTAAWIAVLYFSM